MVAFMIPVLYSPDETDFTSNGLGLLNDAIECTVEEERNGIYQLHMEYPVDGVHFGEIEEMSIIKAVPADGKPAQPFDVYRISAPLNGRVEIDARHISQRLSKNTVMPFTSTSVTDAFLQIKNKSVEQDDFTYWTDKTSSGTMKITAPRSVRAALGGSEGSILDSFGGGDYEWDGFTVKLWADRGFDKGVTLRYGKNITDINQERNIENTVTGIVPFWKGDDSEGTETVVTLTERAVYAQNAGNYPYARTIPIDFSEKFQSQPTEAQLRSAAQRYITSNKIGVPSVSIDVSFVPLWQTEEYKNIANLERVNLCDTVTVEFEKLGISAKAKVIKTEYNVLKDRYDSISIGNARTSFSDSISEKISSTANAIKQTIPKESVFRQIVNEQTQKITGGLGGYVVKTLNANNEPQEILIMDTDDVQTAVNVIRINKSGIGFSTNGYNGPFQSAWTIDGHFNADFIATGHLLANFIHGGTLSLGGTNNGNGVIEVYDANGTLIGRWDKEGLKVYKGLIQGPDIVAGGLNNTNGTIVVKDASGNEIGRWDKDGAVITGSLKMLGDTTYCTIGNTPTYVNYVVEGLVQRTLENLQYVIPYDSNGHVRAIKTFVKADVGNIQEILAVAGTVAQRLVVITTGSYLPEINTSSDVDKIRGYEERVTYNSTNGAVYRIIPLVGSGHDTGLEIYKNHVKLGKFTCDGEGMIGANRELDIPANSSSATIDGNTIAYASSSSKRYKHNINRSITGDRDPHNLLNLPVAEFIFNDDHPTQYADMKGETIPGIIAEDVAEIYPSAVIHSEDGEVESWDERRIIPGMLALIQEQDKTIKNLEARLAKLEELLT